MDENGNSLSNVYRWIWAGLVLLVISLIMLGFNDGIAMPGTIIFIAGLLVVGSQTGGQWSAIDIIVTAIVFTDILSAVYSINPVATLHGSTLRVMAWLCYMIIRSLMRNGRIFSFIYRGYTIVALSASIIAIITYIMFVYSANNAGITNMYIIRYLYRPLGYSNNCWGEIAILIIGASCLLTRWRGVAVYISTLAALLTFSRGTYISLFIFSILLIVTLHRRSRLKNICLGLILSFVTVAAIFPDEVATTIAINKTASQQSSINWRMSTTTLSISRFKERPLLGHGSSTYTLAVNDDGGDGYFTDTAPNLLSQIIVEKGLMGLALAAALVIAIAKSVIRHRRHYESIVVGTTLLALLAKDMSQAILLLSPAILLPATLQLAYIQRRDRPEPVKSRNLLPTRALGIIAAVWVAVNSLLLIHPETIDRENLALRQAMTAIANGDTNEAITQLCHTERLSRYDKNIRHILTELYINSEQYGKARESLCQLTIDEAIGYSQMARIHYADNQRDSSRRYWSQALTSRPALVRTADFKTLGASDTTIVNEILSDIDNRFASTSLTPSESAKYGYILSATNRRDQATPYLIEATNDAPNLITPWLLLGDRPKYDFLRRGIGAEPSSAEIDQPSTDILGLIIDEFRTQCLIRYSVAIPSRK